MYQIKSKPGFNIILKSIGKNLRSEGEWVTLTDEEFNSFEVQRNLDIIIINDGKSTKVKKETKNISNQNNMFYHNGNLYENPKNVFVKTQEDIINPQDIIINNKEEKIIYVNEPEKEVILDNEIKEETKEEIITEEKVKEKNKEEKTNTNKKSKKSVDTDK